MNNEETKKLRNLTPVDYDTMKQGFDIIKNTNRLEIASPTIAWWVTFVTVMVLTSHSSELWSIAWWTHTAVGGCIAYLAAAGSQHLVRDHFCNKLMKKILKEI